MVIWKGGKCRAKQQVYVQYIQLDPCAPEIYLMEGGGLEAGPAAAIMINRSLRSRRWLSADACVKRRKVSSRKRKYLFASSSFRSSVLALQYSIVMPCNATYCTWYLSGQVPIHVSVGKYCYTLLLRPYRLRWETAWDAKSNRRS